MLSQCNSKTDHPNQVNNNININYVYGVVQVFAWSKIPDDLNLVEEYYKSERHEKNALQDKQYHVKAANGVDLSLSDLQEYCEYNQKKYKEFMLKNGNKNSSFWKYIFFSRIDVIHPITKKVLYFNDFEYLSKHFNKHPTLFNVIPKPLSKSDADFQIKSIQNNKSNALSNNANSLWKHLPNQNIIATVGIGTAVIGAGIAILHSYKK